ncbi:HCL251Cp [Eremothecium sinecaudum]|uniref:HCL251Cp n=1 Tax=Eremothecium sinecaudum TaxID=45286 RepID=A0A0X8HR40_9SACH|nr:HCL251Cp [Eremothecium sinecaudum]AMD19900.1 HCL251Cp [Eremothecium sinecaudum]
MEEFHSSTTAGDQDYNSGNERNDDEIIDLGSNIQGTVIPDNNPQYISADSELTATLPDDIEVIDLVHLKIQSMEALNLHRFPKLKRLHLRQNLIESISEVEVLPADVLEELDLYDNRIKHISRNVNKLVNLKSLDLSFNKIKHIKNLENLERLESLYFVQNKISTIENLNSFPNLKSLELGGNNITDIGPESLKGLSTLEEIWLGKNSISRLMNLQYLKNLKILSIQSNKLKKIEGLEDLVNLEELYLSHNFIEKIEGLEKNTKLNTLDVTANRLTKIENLKHLKCLTDLWASFNQIDQSFESLGEELGSLPVFETIYLEGNPIQTKNATTYRRKLVLNLGSLQKIDATYIRG